MTFTEESIQSVEAICDLLEQAETETWQNVGRPKNDGYINGSHSGYGHALKDMRKWMKDIRWGNARLKDKSEIANNDWRTILDSMYKLDIMPECVFCPHLADVCESEPNTVIHFTSEMKQRMGCKGDVIDAFDQVYVE